MTGPPRVEFNHVAEDFFRAFDVPLVAGRWLTAADARNAARPIVVNQTFVRRVLGNRDAVGMRLRFIRAPQDGLALGDSPSDRDDGAVETEPWHEIAGVAGDLSTNPIDPELVRPAVFHALDTGSGSRATLLVKVRGQDAAAFAAPLREIAMTLDPTLRVNLRTFVEMERQQQIARRLIVLALSLITVAVLLLSSASIYALMSFRGDRWRTYRVQIVSFDDGMQPGRAAEGARFLTETEGVDI